MKIAILCATGLLLAAGLLKLVVLSVEPHMTFFPLRGITRTPRQLDIPFREIPVKTRDGETVHAWLLDHPETQTEIVFFHGNGGNLSLWLDFLAELYHQSFTVLAIDYRGYGKSTGSPTEDGLYQDTQALVHYFWDQLHQQDRKVVYWGRSLGGVMAAYAGTIREPDGLVLEATFPDKQSFLSHHGLLRILGVFSRYRFPTAEFLSELTRPTLVIHGREDRVVPFAEGRKLFAQLQTEKYFYEIAGAGHNDLQLIDPQTYRERVQEFIEKLDPEPDSG